MTGSRGAICTILVLLVIGPARAPRALADDKPGSNDDADEARSALRRARAEIGQLRYGEALATLATALKAGASGPAATAQIYLLMGEVQASLGRKKAAEKAFRLALTIDPRLELRRGVSPKIGRPFRKARRAQRGTPAMEMAHRVVKTDPPTVAVTVRSDPLGMVKGARIEYWTATGGSRSVIAGGGVGGEIELELPRGVSQFALALVDEHGNRLVELGDQDRPLALETEPREKRPSPAAEGDEDDGASPATAAPPPAPGERAPPPTEPSSVGASARPEAAEVREKAGGPPFYGHWLLWGGVALGLGAAGTWAGLSAQTSIEELDDIRGSQFEFEFSEAQKVADRAEQRALIANICFAAAGASAIVSGVLFIRGRHRRSEDSAALVPVVGHGEIGVAAWLRF